MYNPTHHPSVSRSDTLYYGSESQYRTRRFDFGQTLMSATFDCNCSEKPYQDDDTPFLKTVDVSSCFDIIFLLTIDHTSDLNQGQDISKLSTTIRRSPSVPSCDTCDSDSLVRKFTNGMETSSLDPATLPSPKLLLRARSRSAA
jgi:hypothetical protein